MREFTVGCVLRRVFALFRAHPGLLLGLAALFVALPHAAALAALQFEHPRNAGFAAIPFVAYWLGGLLLEAAVVRAAIDAANGQPSRFGSLIGTAARFFFPILAITIMARLATAAAAILLLFPGLMLVCRWFVVIPAEVAESSGITAAFGRSATLTDGVRWRVFGMLLVMGVLNLAISIGVGLLGGLVGRSLGIGWPILTASVIASATSMLISSLVYAATYLELREIREGAMSEDLVSVFS